MNIYEPIWYIKVWGRREGPYSVLALKRDCRVTPDTLVWRYGFDCWQKLRHVPELRIILEKDEETIIREYGDEERRRPKDDQIVLGIEPNNHGKWIWMLLLAAVLLYLWGNLWK